MNTLKLSMAEHRDVLPYKLTNGINIYSLEEAIYLFYQNFKEYSSDFFEDKFTKWVRNELLNVEMANKLVEIQKQSNFYQKSIEFLTLNNFYTLEDIEIISVELFNWEIRGQVDRYKIKGDRFFQRNMFEKAIESYKMATEFDISNYILYNNIGVCYLRLNQYEMAISYLKKAINLSPDNEDVIINIVEILIEKEEFNEVENYISSLKDLYTKNYYLGELNFKKKDYDYAIQYYKNAYDEKNTNDVILKIAKCYLKQGFFDKSTKTLEKIESEDIDVILEKANIYEMLNNTPMAIKVLEKANFYTRDNYILWLKLAKYYRKDYNLLKAEGAISKAYTLAPDNKEVLFEQSLIKKVQGRFKEYQNILNKIVEKSSDEYRERINKQNSN